VQLHGGSIEISSAKSSGTELAVILPSAREVAVTDSASVALSESAAS
jgi:hypothetical protein